MVWGNPLDSQECKYIYGIDWVERAWFGGAYI